MAGGQQRSQGAIANSGIAGRDPVTGYVRKARRVDGFESFSDAPMCSCSSCTTLEFVQRLLDEHVRERVLPSFAAFAYERCRLGDVEHDEHLVHIEFDNTRENTNFEVRADDGRRGQHSFSDVAESGHAHADDITDRLGRRYVAWRRGAVRSFAEANDE